MTMFVDGSINLLRTSTQDEAEETLGATAALCDVWGMQENEGDSGVQKAVAAMKASPEVAMYIPQGAAGAVPIAWHPDVFQTLGGRGYKMTHRGIKGVTPSRYFTWQPLLHKVTSAKVLKINTHAISGYASDNFPDQQTIRDTEATKHWHVGADLARHFIQTDRYDVILMGGDFNVRLENVGEQWYPSHLLKPFFNFDQGRGIDRLIWHGKVEPVKRTNTRKGITSDHPLAYCKYRLV